MARTYRVFDRLRDDYDWSMAQGRSRFQRRADNALVTRDGISQTGYLGCVKAKANKARRDADRRACVI